MAIKIILVPVDGSPESLETLNSAFNIANRFGAHVRALHVVHSSFKAVAHMSDRMTVSFRAEIEARAKEEARENADASKAQFEAYCKEHNAAISSDPSSAGATAEWVEEVGEVADVLLKWGRLSDVIVISRPHKAGKTELFRGRSGENLEAIMLGTGRPMFIIPPAAEVGSRKPAKHVAIGWNGSQESARALSMAMPWLPMMESVTILVSEKRKESASEVLDYLSWHGVKGSVVTIDGKGKNTADSILKSCESVNADILVVGGFSHSRARELLFGGVTSHLLSNANIATLMVH